MEVSASAVANYFLDLSQEDGGMKHLGLIKRIYVVHGLSLAILDRPVLSSKYGEVLEAWKYGPVIPSIYHEFKRFGSQEIKNFKSKISPFDLFGLENNFEAKDAILEDLETIDICCTVFDKYKNTSDKELVDLTHEKGTPWWQVYKPGLNNIIPNSLVKKYYKGLLNTV